MTSFNLVSLLKEKGLKISFAESCTGGLLSKCITDISGSSSVLSESYVTYSEDAKNKILGVPLELIKKHSVVSSEVAISMAEGLYKKGSSDISVSVTGVAGPNGDEYQNPVGLVFVGIKDRHTSFSKKLLLSGNRDEIRKKACFIAFNIVSEHINKFF